MIWARFSAGLRCLLGWICVANTGFSALTVEELRKIQSVPAAVTLRSVEVKTSAVETAFYLGLVKRLDGSATGKELLKTAQHLKFRFAGFTGTASKANTDPETGLVRLREGPSVDVSTLSLAYELSNAINAGRFQDIFARAKKCELDGPRFVTEILRLEAEAILWRSVVAQELKLDAEIENKNFHRLATNSMDSPSEKRGLIMDELRASGKVTSKRVAVVAHYTDLFTTHYPHCLKK